jgi:hypothetical protein
MAKKKRSQVRGEWDVRGAPWSRELGKGSRREPFHDNVHDGNRFMITCASRSFPEFSGQARSPHAWRLRNRISFFSIKQKRSPSPEACGLCVVPTDQMHADFDGCGVPFDQVFRCWFKSSLGSGSPFQLLARCLRATPPYGLRGFHFDPSRE